MFATALLIAAFVLFLLAAVGAPVPKVNLVAAGLACATLAVMWPRLV
jgi:hypothetical protein